MTWIGFSILAALTWAIVNILDKFILTKWVKDPVIVLGALSVANLLFGIGIFVFRDTPTIPTWNILVCVLAGCFYGLGNWLYFLSIQKEEVSKVISLLYLDPLYTAVLAIVFLHELLSPTGYIGIILLIAGAILISTDKFKMNIRKEARLTIYLAPAAFAICNVLNKVSFNHGDFWPVLAYYRIGSGLGLMVILCFKYRTILEEIKRLKGKLILIFSNESLNVVGALFFALAIAGGFVSSANALTAIQPLFVFIFATGISVLYPQIINEHITKKIITTKLFAIILLITGTILITT